MSTARAEKAAVVAEVRDKLAASNSVIVSEYRGLTVGALAKLRRTLRPLGAEYKVYKNSLVKIAARDGAMAPVEPMVGGPVAITFVTGEVSAVAKAMREFAKENEALKPMIEGVELTLKSMQSGVAKFGLVALDPINQPFDSNAHQAMSMVPSADVAPNTVIAVMQKGYDLNGRVIRPAMVMIAKAVD